MDPFNYNGSRGYRDFDGFDVYDDYIEFDDVVESVEVGNYAGYSGVFEPNLHPRPPPGPFPQRCFTLSPTPQRHIAYPSSPQRRTSRSSSPRSDTGSLRQRRATRSSSPGSVSGSPSLRSRSSRSSSPLGPRPQRIVRIRYSDRLQRRFRLKEHFRALERAYLHHREMAMQRHQLELEQLYQLYFVFCLVLVGQFGRQN
ncbi:hypothetical protein BU24DRAFT_424510, partial [Aaosphaeria arxii CBS 175.79]